MFNKRFKKSTSILLTGLLITGGLVFSNPKVNAASINGWNQNAATWYYYKNGAKMTDWLSYGTNWYYLNSNGAMAKGWLKDGTTWYYLNSNGSMAKGWLLYNSKWYYLNNDGSMAVNTAIDGWTTGADGAFTETFNIGQTATIHDTLWGTYELTVNSVEITNERNKFEEYNPAEVYKVTYTYKLLSKGSSTSMGLFIFEFNSAVDSMGKTAKDYPNNIIKTPKELNSVGDSCIAETFICVDNLATKLVLTKQYFNATGSDIVKFIIPTK